MNKVTPRDFRNAFLAVMQAERDNFRAALGFESKSYNFFMRTTIYPRVGRQLGLQSWNKEYYTLDGMLYEERGVDDTGRYATYANWISVAIEHESDSARAHEKMNKLQSLPTPPRAPRRKTCYASTRPSSGPRMCSMTSPRCASNSSFWGLQRRFAIGASMPTRTMDLS